jgi:chromosome segregation ATPase
MTALQAIAQLDAQIELLYSQIEDWETDLACDNVTYEVCQQNVYSLRRDIDTAISQIEALQENLVVVEEGVKEGDDETMVEIAMIDAQVEALDQRINGLTEEYSETDEEEMWVINAVAQIKAEREALVKRIMYLEAYA